MADKLLNLGIPNPKQREFLTAKQRFVGYGGARGGGKSWAVRTKAILLCLFNPGIKILILRKTYPELEANHISILRRQLMGIAKYNDSKKTLTFPSGSVISFGYCDNERDVDRYQGHEYDVIFIDEATHFTETQFEAFKACNRGANDLPKRIYLTCNPGGVGHEWVKRLFIDRRYRENERAEDYAFIKATVYDNEVLLKNDPEYLSVLESLQGDRRRAWLEGDWDLVAGQFFPEFRRDVHVCDPFEIPKSWRRYCAFDYGLDMFACLWAAMDESGKCYIYREIHESDLIISEAAKRILAVKDDVYAVLAPSDLWGRSQESGKSRAELFYQAGVRLSKVVSGRVDGWSNLREWLHIDDGKSGIAIFSTCENLIRNLPLLQHDLHRPEDCMTQPHEITHAPDALRYLLAGRPCPQPKKEEPKKYNFEFEKPKPSPTGRGEKIKII